MSSSPEGKVRAAREFRTRGQKRNFSFESNPTSLNLTSRDQTLKLLSGVTVDGPFEFELWI